MRGPVNALTPASASELTPAPYPIIPPLIAVRYSWVTSGLNGLMLWLCIKRLPSMIAERPTQ
ncbi:hypothetical protein GCM10023321_50580 [Pseudonocardia eucalypti]|uniref:Uncharacterized protein n=1 Tax=Pseudonocardia eucalypti TaxID=648755 RepID=A0ABP9QKM2_9PSEU